MSDDDEPDVPGDRRDERGKENSTPAGDEDQADDFVGRCLVVLLEALWGMVRSVAVPTWELVRYVCWDTRRR